MLFRSAAVLKPFVVHRADRLQIDDFPAIEAALRTRMRGLFTDPPLPYRQQNGGEYDIPGCELRPGLEATGASGFSLHLNQVIDR